MEPTITTRGGSKDQDKQNHGICITINFSINNACSFGLRKEKKKKKELREERYLGKEVEKSFICNTSAGRIFEADILSLQTFKY